MKLDLQNGAALERSTVGGESRAFVLLETARLRCESLMACFGRLDQIVAIHREVGLAGYITSTEFTADHRRQCLAQAAARLADGSDESDDATTAADPELGRTLARMFSETISASDALAAELSTNDVDDDQRDRLHLVHAHVMSACELLDECLTVLELQGVAVEA